MPVEGAVFGAKDSSLLLKVHKHEIFFLTFFAETETIWSQGPVTRDFLKSYFELAEIFDF